MLDNANPPIGVDAIIKDTTREQNRATGTRGAVLIARRERRAKPSDVWAVIDRSPLIIAPTRVADARTAVAPAFTCRAERGMLAERFSRMKRRSANSLSPFAGFMVGPLKAYA